MEGQNYLDVIVSVQNELAFLLFYHIIAIFGILVFEVRNLISMHFLPGVTEQVSSTANIVMVSLHFIFGESLLHAHADERLTVLREPLENLDEGQRLFVRLVGAFREIFDRMNQTA